ncbi:phosphatase PAP2 family protein [uncultured Pontibacter sp.]|uniref:phosphatase PAP2 family protein n=1 Tax=uncultured Pontibacter sp. TaxID=453356 RepID=UPI0026084F4B|nr:phosphatase PAP2 family protein [uncultured Pontibacter sp.]
MKNYLLLFILFFPVTAISNENRFIPDTTVVEQLNDSTLKPFEERGMLRVARSAIVPVTMISVGLMHMDDEGLFEGSRGLRRVVRRHYNDFTTNVDDYIYHGPVAMAVGLNLAGVHGEHHFTEQAILLGMTHLLNRTITNNLKSITDIKRPNGTSRDAFPSAHTSTAFAYATFFHKEYGARSVWYSIAGYSFATATGAMRILNDKHWLSDVLVGAGIGILSAEAVYMIYPLIQEKIAQSHLKKKNLAMMPFYTNGAGGIALVYRIL